MNSQTEDDSRAGNPYASPVAMPETFPVVEVVHRRHFVWRKYQQTYRFRCEYLPSVLLESIESFYVAQSTALLSRSESSFQFERIGVRPINQFFRLSETLVPQRITVTLEREGADTVVTCRYHVRIWTPDIIVPPYQLEDEVRALAVFCS